MSPLLKIYAAYEEYNSIEVDKYNRFPYLFSENRTIFKPTVSQYLYAQGFSPQYPNNKDFAVCLSHDVDHLYIRRNQKIKILLNERTNNFFSNLRSVFQRKIYPPYSLSKILEMEKKYNAISSFYFLSLNQKDEGFNYHLSEVVDQFKLIEESGCEIGLHGGHNAYNNSKQLSAEKNRLSAALKREVTGYRNHYLKFKTPVTWNILEENKFEYDTTFGYSDCVGFRNGMCYPFRPFDIDKNEFIDVVEVPLIIMDGSLFFNMKLDFNYALTICKKIIKEVKECNGVLSILWHNSMMDGEYGEFYEQILKTINEENAWVTSTKKIVDHWKQSGYLNEMEDILMKSKREV